MDYLTLICDIKESKKLHDREAVQYKLIDLLKDVNSKFSSLVASPFIITLGDEWQGLLHYPCDYSELLGYFRKKLAPIEFYCGIGIGHITISNFELTVNQLDGPSFHKARKAIKLAKEQNYNLVLIE
jgi:hypothetical protein